MWEFPLTVAPLQQQPVLGNPPKGAPAHWILCDHRKFACTDYAREGGIIRVKKERERKRRKRKESR